MRSVNLPPVVYAALLFGCAIANAQTSPPPSDPSSTTPASTQADTTNEQFGRYHPPDQTAPAKRGPDKASGNDMVSPKGDATPSGRTHLAAARPDFDTLDASKTGALTADDVKGNNWLSKNFSRCDTNHDGGLSREEYAACK
jgi:hypothetical protein